MWQARATLLHIEPLPMALLAIRHHRSQMPPSPIQDQPSTPILTSETAVPPAVHPPSTTACGRFPVEDEIFLLPLRRQLLSSSGPFLSVRSFLSNSNSKNQKLGYCPPIGHRCNKQRQNYCRDVTEIFLTPDHLNWILHTRSAASSPWQPSTKPSRIRSQYGDGPSHGSVAFRSDQHQDLNVAADGRRCLTSDTRFPMPYISNASYRLENVSRKLERPKS